MAKQANGSQARKDRPKGKVLRQLEKTQTAHQKAERKVGKLRARLERAETKLRVRLVRAEARLAREAQRLLEVHATLHPVGDNNHAPTPAQDSAAPGEQVKAEPAHHATTAKATDEVKQPRAAKTAKAIAASKPARPRGNRRVAGTANGSHTPAT